jgi:putative ABC transport system ATP-binding protein
MAAEELIAEQTQPVRSAAPSVLSMRGVSKRYRSSESAALVDAAFELHAGETVALLGPSGAGKSTILQLAAGLTKPDAGEIWVAGTNTTSMSDDELAVHRGNHIGLVFQFFNLIESLTAKQNVALPLVLAGADGADERASEALRAVQLLDKASRMPGEMSGGEMQRVAVARALVTGPSLLLADEPTGNLDSASGEVVMHTLLDLAASQGSAVLIVSHNDAHAEMAARTLRIVDGRLTDA